MSFRPFVPFRAFGGGAALDPDVAAFVAATGATDTATINALSVYLKAQSLWTSCRFFPFKSAQNKGSGTTVYGLGGWTSNHIELVNGPTWGATGVAFDATDDRATWTGTGIQSLNELYFFDVQKPTNASLADTQRFGQLAIGDSATVRNIYANITSGILTGETVGIGISSSAGDIRRVGDGDVTWSAGQQKQIVSRFAQTGSMQWASKTASAMAKTSGTQDFRPSQAGWETNSILNINAYYSGGSYSTFVATTRVALLACKTSLTQAQREAITDYLDAL